MAQRGLPYEYEIEESMAGLMSFGGFCSRHGAHEFGRPASEEIRKGDQGWKYRQMILSLALLNLVGGDCVEDIDKLEADEC